MARPRRSAPRRRVSLRVSYDALLADARVDVVHVTTPNHLHHGQVRDALVAGKHVVCEKPLATTSAESAELLELATTRGLVHCTNFNLRFYPIAHHARAVVASGELGTAVNVHGGYLQDWLLYPTDWNWRLEPEGGALRAVADIGSHWMDLAQWVGGRRIEAVFADFKTALPVRQRPAGEVETFASADDVERVDAEMTTEDIAHLLFRFEEGTWARPSSQGERRAQELAAVGGRRVDWIPGLGLGARRGAVGRPPRPCQRDAPAQPGAARAVGRGPDDVAGRSRRGFAETFREAYAPFTAVAEGRMPSEPDFPTFADGHRANVLGDAVGAFQRRAAMGGGDDVRARPVDGGAARCRSRSRRVGGERGFEMLEVACWPAASGPARRYAGVCHIDVDDLDPDAIRQTMSIHGLEISSLALLPEQPRERRGARGGERAPAQGDRRCRHARGRDRRDVRRRRPDAPVARQPRAFRSVWPPLVEYAEERGVKVAIENCR